MLVAIINNRDLHKKKKIIINHRLIIIIINHELLTIDIILTPDKIFQLDRVYRIRYKFKLNPVSATGTIFFQTLAAPRYT